MAIGKNQLIYKIESNKKPVTIHKYEENVGHGLVLGEDKVSERNFFYKRKLKKREKELEQMVRLGSEVALRIGLWNQSNDRIVRYEKYMMGDENAIDPFEDGCSALVYRIDEGYVFSVLEPPHGMTREDLIRKCDEMKEVLFDSEELCTPERMIKTLELVIGDNIYTLSPKMTVLFRDEKRPDPLDDVWKVNSVDEIEFDRKSMKFYTAMKETGERFAIPFENNGGFLVGGVAGSGKSASFILMVMAMLRQNAIELTVIDGKTAPTELDRFERYGLADVHKFKMVDGKRNYEEILEVVENFDREVAERAEVFEERFGVTNYWNIPVEERPKLKMLLIDECQVFFNSKGKPPEERKLIETIQATVENTVRIARAYGGMVCLATQKPSADAISTDLRDNCGLKLSLRAETQNAEAMVLGERGEDAEEKYFATRIGSGQQGLAITKNEMGFKERVRFAYYPDKAMLSDLEKIAEQKLKEV